MLPVAGKDRISSERLLLRQVVCSRETHAVSVEGVDFCWVFVKLQEKQSTAKVKDAETLQQPTCSTTLQAHFWTIKNKHDKWSTRVINDFSKLSAYISADDHLRTCQNWFKFRVSFLAVNVFLVETKLGSYKKAFNGLMNCQSASEVSSEPSLSEPASLDCARFLAVNFVPILFLIPNTRQQN